MSPHVEQLLYTHLYLCDVIVPVGGTIVGTFAAWAVLPRIFRRFHKYSTEGPGTFLPAGSLWSAVPYEKSFWGALEVPVSMVIKSSRLVRLGTIFRRGATIPPCTVKGALLVSFRPKNDFPVTIPAGFLTSFRRTFAN
ncbi:hypothetical protein Hanom_Chr14g01279591 [Helianthus anomalus]